MCRKHYKTSVEDAKAKKIDRNRSRANFAEQQSTQWIAPIEMGDTAYGHFKVQMKRDVEIVYQKMSAEEKESFKRKMAEIDETGPCDG